MEQKIVDGAARQLDPDLKTRSDLAAAKARQNVQQGIANPVPKQYQPAALRDGINKLDQESPLQTASTPASTWENTFQPQAPNPLGAIPTGTPTVPHGRPSADWGSANSDDVPNLAEPMVAHLKSASNRSGKLPNTKFQDITEVCHRNMLAGHSLLRSS